jgi:site-specific recombinase XerD
VKEHTLGKVLRAALSMAGLPRMKWYEATRHSFASRYVQAGGSLVKLASILGHSATEVTLRYAHLQPGNFTAEERAFVDVQLEPAKVLAILGQTA